MVSAPVNLSAAALRLMADKGLTLIDVAEIVAANDVRADPTNAQRQARHRAKKAECNGVTVTRDKGSNERDNLTSQAEVSEPRGSSPQPRAWSLPAGVSFQVWTDLKKNRAKKRLPNTDTAWKAFLDDVERVSSQTGIPPPELIERCTAKGWGGIYDPTEGKHHGQSASNVTSLRGTRPDPALDLLRAARAAENREADRGTGSALPAIGSG